MEVISKKDKVIFINDSKATNAEAASKAIDMTNFRESLGVLRVGYDLLAVSRMYERMGGEE